MKRAYSITDIQRKRYDAHSLGASLDRSVGLTDLCGLWLVYGGKKNGKTSFAMQLAKLLSGSRRVLYNSTEEGVGFTIRLAVERFGLDEVRRNLRFLDRESPCDLAERLKRRGSAEVVFIDTVQHSGMQVPDLNRLMSLYPRKLFVFVSHVRSGAVDGLVARRIHELAMVTFRVQDFMAYPDSRYGGTQEAIVVSEDRARESRLVTDGMLRL